MTDASDAVGMLRSDPDAFDALRDATAERLSVDPGAVEKDYWATEVLRSAASPLEGVDQVVFKGGTSLSKAYGIIERFSEDIDLLVVTGLTGKPLKRLLRMIANRASAHLDVEHVREREGRGFSMPATATRSDARSRSSPPGCCSRSAHGADRPPTSTCRSDPSCPTPPTRSTPRRATTTPTWPPSRSPCSPPNARWPRSWPFCTTAPPSAILTRSPEVPVTFFSRSHPFGEVRPFPSCWAQNWAQCGPVQSVWPHHGETAGREIGCLPTPGTAREGSSAMIALVRSSQICDHRRYAIIFLWLRSSSTTRSWLGCSVWVMRIGTGRW